MPTRYFLNSLRTREGGLPGPDRGIWHRDSLFLTRYAGDVSLEGELDVEKEPHSVPSVFQRPFQFLHALQHVDYPLHRYFQSEWRGMMATILLKNWLNIPLTATPFSVPTVGEQESSYVGNENTGNLHFRAMLRNQLPYRKIELENGVLRANERRVSDWETWSVIRCDGQLIGATSPWTMLYTASKTSVPGSIPWQHKGRLIDPIAYFSALRDGPSVQTELQILDAAVTNILSRRGLWGFAPELTAFSNLYFNLLTAWQTDLARYANPELKLGSTTSLFKEAPYSNSVPVVGWIDRDDGDLYINSKKGKVIVFSGTVGANRRVHRSVFAGQVDVAQLGAFGESFKTIDGREVPQRFVVAEKAFFPSKLIHLSFSNHAFLAKGAPSASTPLTATFFQYFDHKNLSWLSCVENGGRITATLTFPLLRGGTTISEHDYLPRDLQTLDMQTPGAAIWPDFYDEEWKGGFAAYSATDSDDLSVSPLFRSGREVLEEEQARIDKNQTEVRIWQCEQEPAIGFSLRWRPKGDPHEPVASGLILLKELRSIGEFSETRTAHIGVDFGTSSTTVMMLNRDGKPMELNFGGHLVPLTFEEIGRTKEIERNLYPSGEVKPPFRTLLFEAKAKQFGRNTTPYTVRFETDVKNDLLNAPIAELKWGARTGRDGSNPLTAYLNGLVRYIVWECVAAGIKHIELSWSYPTSLPNGQLTTMRNFWTTIKQPDRYRKGVTIKVMPEMSESEAACRALTAGSARLRTGSLTIAVDIGGGSADIAYWSSKVLLDQVSFKLAGNDILDQSLLTEPAMVAIYGAVAKPKPSDDEMSSIRNRPEIYLNDLLAQAQEDGDPRRHPLRNYIFDGRDDAYPWQEFRSMIYLYFSGLCYYMGAQARSLAVEKPEIEVYFGGRGAGLLSWFAAESDDIRRVLAYSFRLGLNRPKDGTTPNKFPVSPEVLISFHGLAIASNADLPKLKTEVAKGLLLEPDLKLTDGLTGGVAAGETGWLMKKEDTKELAPVEWTSRLLPEQLNGLKAPDDFESSMIGYFRYVVLEEDKEKYLTNFNLDMQHLKALKVEGGAVEDLIKRSAEKKDQVAQPIFAYELKAMMKQYARMVSEHGAQDA